MATVEDLGALLPVTEGELEYIKTTTPKRAHINFDSYVEVLRRIERGEPTKSINADLGYNHGRVNQIVTWWVQRITLARLRSTAGLMRR